MKSKDLWESKLLHTFLYYDRPLFFIAQTEDGKKVLNYLIDEKEDKKSEVWFVCFIEERELEELMSLQSEVKQFLQYKIRSSEMLYADIPYGENSEITFEKVTPQNFNIDFLPEEPYFLEYDYHNDIELSKIK